MELTFRIGKKIIYVGNQNIYINYSNILAILSDVF